MRQTDPSLTGQHNLLVKTGLAAAGLLLAAGCTSNGSPVRLPETSASQSADFPSSSTSETTVVPAPTQTLNPEIFNTDFRHCTAQEIDKALPNYQTELEHKPTLSTDQSYSVLADAAQQKKQAYFANVLPTGIFMQVILPDTDFVGVRYLYDRGDTAHVDCTAFSLILKFGRLAGERTVEVRGKDRNVLAISPAPDNHLTMEDGSPVTPAAAAEFGVIAKYSVQGFSGGSIGR